MQYFVVISYKNFPNRITKL